MTFTDDDLKRLKAAFGNCYYRFQVDKPHDLWVSLDGLLARLEAAEKVIEGSTHVEVDYPEQKCAGCANMVAWRKAAGK